METEILNTFLGVIKIPAWLEASLAVSFIGFLMWLSHKRTRSKIEADLALIEACKKLTSACTGLIIANQNQEQVWREIASREAVFSVEFLDKIVTHAIQSAHLQSQVFAEANRTNQDISRLAQGYAMDAYLDFAKYLGSIRCVDGTNLADFARLCKDEFDFWANGMEHNENPYLPCERLQIQLTQKWRRWSGLNISRTN